MNKEITSVCFVFFKYNYNVNKLIAKSEGIHFPIFYSPILLAVYTE